MLFEWTEQRVNAAELLAARNLTHQEVAESVGVVRSTLWEWRKLPEFAARVKEITEENRAETRRIGIADKERRLSVLNDRWGRLRRVIEARADDPEIAKAPGGSTGLLARTLKLVGSGDAATVIEEFTLDAGLLRELREHEKQAAVELGQWNEKAPAAEELRGVLSIRNLLHGDHADTDDPDA